MSTENWSRTVRFDPREVFSVSAPSGDAYAALVARVAQIEAKVSAAVAAGRHVRAVGSLWSFSTVVRSDDVMIDTSGLSQVIDATRDPGGARSAGRLSQALDASVTGRDFAFVEAGAMLHPLFGALRDRGLTVITAGSSSGQTIAGVLSTSTHGADFRIPPLPDAMRALVVVTPAGERLWVERASGRLTKDDAAAQGLCAGARVVRDDALFDAWLVSLGTMGVVCALVIEVVPLYGLSEKTMASSWHAVRPRLSESAPPSETIFGPTAPTDPGNPHPAPSKGTSEYGFLEVIVNPYRTSDRYGGGSDDRRVQLCSRVMAPEDPGTAWTRPKPGLWDNLHTLWTILDGSQSDFRAQVDTLIEEGRTDSDGFHPAPDVFDFGQKRNSRVWSAEAVIRTKGDAHLAFLDAVFARFDALFAQGRKLAGFLSIRFTQGTRASLGMQSGPTGPSGRYCHAEFFALEQPKDLGGWDPTRLAADSQLFMEAYWQEAHARAASGDVVLHWGQDGRSPEDFAVRASRFPRLGEWRAARASVVGDHPFVFTNDFCVRAGLTPLADGWTLASTAIPTDLSQAPLDCSALAAAAPVYARASGVSSHDTVYAVQGDGYVGVLPWTGAAAAWSLARASARPGPDDAIAGAVAVALNADGRPELFARAHDGHITHRWVTKVVLGHPSEWSEQADFDGSPRFDTDPAAALGSDDHLHVVAVDRDAKVQSRRQTSLGGWTGWGELAALPLGRRATGKPALVRRADGALALFVRDLTGSVWSSSYANGGWSAWTDTRLSGVGGDPAAAASSAGILVVAPRTVGGLTATFVGPSGPGTPSDTFGTVALRPGTRVAVCSIANQFAVAITEPTGQVVRWVHAGAAGWTAARAPIAAHAVSTPTLVASGSSDVLVLTKVAHDLVQARTVSL